jgi:hypothetical protein
MAHRGFNPTAVADFRVVPVRVLDDIATRLELLDRRILLIGDDETNPDAWPSPDDIHDELNAVLLLLEDLRP